MPRTLTGSELHEALAVRLQAQAYSADIEYCRVRAELAQERLQALSAQRPGVEARLLRALGAPEGARFNWDTFGYDEPEAAAEAAAAR